MPGQDPPNLPGWPKNPGEGLRGYIPDPVPVALRVYAEPTPQGDEWARPQPPANLAQAIFGRRDPGCLGSEFPSQQPVEVVVRRSHVAGSPVMQSAPEPHGAMTSPSQYDS